MSRIGDVLTAASHAANLAQGALTWRDRRRTPQHLRSRAIVKASRLRRLAARRQGRSFRAHWIRTSATLLKEAKQLDAEVRQWDAVIRGDPVPL